TPEPGAFFSSYYQPVLDASRVETPEFRYPIYARPPDLLQADLGAFDPKLRGRQLFGRATSSGTFVPYFSRGDIDVRRELAGKGLELAWLKDDFDRLDLHIEGSGILRFPDGGQALAQYAATNSLPYRSVGLAVIGSGAMTRSELTHATLKAYLDEHPEGSSWLLARDPRYTFFKLKDLPPDGEPDGFIEQPLTAGRSIAVDPKDEPLGGVCWMSVPLPQADAQGRLLGRSQVDRFVFPQDIGGAIKGPGRVDFYLGHGPGAAEEARRVWDRGALYILLKKLPARTR
ncbi:MAG: MltA domain-containing protein, partial [Elusimicrobia bacterium]|nr:MltA domain-containing protein [Elusimicrobiota bacterium]